MTGQLKNCDEWVDGMLRELLALAHHAEQDNFDRRRFAASLEHTFLLEYHLKHLKFFFGNREALFGAHQQLADEDSKALFDRLLLYRMMGQTHVRLPTNTPQFWEKWKGVEDLAVGEAEEAGPLGRLRLFELEFMGQPIRLKAWMGNILCGFLLRQYFYRRQDVAIAPEPGDHVIDAGSCFGDTALAFAAAIGKTGRVYSFDMMPPQLRIIHQNLEMNPELASRITVLGYGLSDASNGLPEACACEAEAGMQIAPDAQLEETGFPVRSIDGMLDEGRIDRIDFIKMDIEGSELAALRGAEKTLRRFRPRLAISLYHKPEDFYAIPAYLDQLGLGYKLHLGHYTIHAGETVLYARSGA